MNVRGSLLLMAACAGSIAACFGAWSFYLHTWPFEDRAPMVHVASLSVSFPSTPSLPAISGHRGVALSVENPTRGETLGWDHGRVKLLGGERVANTSRERFSVAPVGKATLETTGTVPFSLEAEFRVARALRPFEYLVIYNDQTLEKVREKRISEKSET